MSYKKYDFSAELLRAINDQGYTNPTPIQQRAIPLILTGKTLWLVLKRVLEKQQALLYLCCNA